MDRNIINTLHVFWPNGSLSARRAWIEIILIMVLSLLVEVALRKESVDRNKPHAESQYLIFGSLSARRAWIEITL